ncbi:MAG: GAF domain-containing protein [Proteobacteria bacterium]|nr:GAF domain-containing protein [Pseudomonadota bacterium]
MTFVFEKPTGSKREIFHDLALQAEGLFRGERDAIANAANLASLIFTSLDDLNWAGFYFLKDGVLVLGPFQGRPACVRIAMGKGVCGTAAERRETVLVEDVNAFPGHIACDVASRSEIVVPLIKDGRLIGVLDIDAPIPARFDGEDRKGLETLAGLWLGASDL